MRQLTFESAYPGMTIMYEEENYTVYKAIRSGVYFGLVPIEQVCDEILEHGQPKAFKNCKAIKKTYSKKITFDENQDTKKINVPLKKNSKSTKYKACCKKSWLIKIKNFARKKTLGGFAECEWCGTRYFPLKFVDGILYISRGLERLSFNGTEVKPFLPKKTIYKDLNCGGYQ